jgi:hypothetical protein
MHVIAAAEGGHQDADIALREVGVEMLDRGEMPQVALRNYLQRALVMPVVNYPSGANVINTWIRDIGIAVLVDMAIAFWGLPVSRNPASDLPAAAWVVSKALSRRDFKHLGPAQVARIYRDHKRLADKLCASAGDGCIRQTQKDGGD